MAKPKSYVVVTPKKDDNKIHIPSKKVGMGHVRTVASVQYSFYARAERRAKHQEKKQLREFCGR